MNMTRIAALMAGIPETVTAVTVNRVCISGMEAAVSGMAMIQAGMADVILAGGAEHMSGAPTRFSTPAGAAACRTRCSWTTSCTPFTAAPTSCRIPRTGPSTPRKPPLSLFKGKPYIMGDTAEFVAQHLNIPREEMDEVALRSHNNAERATLHGEFKDEIVPIEIPQRKGHPLSLTRTNTSARA